MHLLIQCCWPDSDFLVKIRTLNEPLPRLPGPTNTDDHQGGVGRRFSTAAHTVAVCALCRHMCRRVLLLLLRVHVPSTTLPQLFLQVVAVALLSAGTTRLSCAGVFVPYYVCSTKAPVFLTPQALSLVVCLSMV